MMARTALATRSYDTNQKGPRRPAGDPSYVVIHHAATINLNSVVALEMGAREVSSTVIIKDGEIVSMFDEQWRAWSLSSEYWDSVSLSSETCNETAAPGWTISEASYQSLAKVVADWCVRYSIPCDRTHIMGHREVYTRYGASYATACPGGIDLDRVVRDATAILNHKISQIEKEVDMSLERIIQDPKSGILHFASTEAGVEPVPTYVSKDMDNATVVAGLNGAFGTYHTPASKWEFDVLTALITRRAEAYRKSLIEDITASLAKTAQ